MVLNLTLVLSPLVSNYFQITSATRSLKGEISTIQLNRKRISSIRDDMAVLKSHLANGEAMLAEGDISNYLEAIALIAKSSSFL